MCPSDATLQKQQEQMAAVFKEEEAEKTLTADPLQATMEKQEDPQQKMADALMVQEQQDKSKTIGKAAPAPQLQAQKHKESFKEKRARKKSEKAELKRQEMVQRQIDSKIIQMEQNFLNQQQGLEQRLEAQYTDWELLRTEDEKKLYEQEKKALNYYTSDHYEGMNKMLREGVPSTEMEEVTSVAASISGLEKAMLPEDLVFRRGTAFGAIPALLGLDYNTHEDVLMAKLKQYNDGAHVMMDRAFLSTSALAGCGFTNKRVDFVIQGHQGDNALYVEPISEFKGTSEKETLFQAGTSFRLLRISPPLDAKGQLDRDPSVSWKVYMETIPGVKPKCGNP